MSEEPSEQPTASEEPSEFPTLSFEPSDEPSSELSRFTDTLDPTLVSSPGDSGDASQLLGQFFDFAVDRESITDSEETITRAEDDNNDFESITDREETITSPEDDNNDLASRLKESGFNPRASKVKGAGKAMTKTP